MKSSLHIVLLISRGLAPLVVQRFLRLVQLSLYVVSQLLDGGHAFGGQRVSLCPLVKLSGTEM